MSEIRIKENESLESALKRFKRQSSGVLAEVRKREHYEKPSVKRKKKFSRTCRILQEVHKRFFEKCKTPV